MARIVVVGSGIAGLTVALRAHHDGHSVVVITKRALLDSNTRWAQGGIAVVASPEDSAERHAEDTMAAGGGLCDADAVGVLCSEGPARVGELINLGVSFDRVGDELALGLEAAHSRRRIVHAGGDATGLAIATALVDAIRAAGIEVLEYTMLVDLLLAEGGVRGVELLGSHRFTLEADTVVLATGGAGQLYPHTTNPEVATGDGIAAAWRAGASVSGLEFVQFHPTALAVAGTPLISEAVRGEGAVLLDARGERFMVGEHADAELAPRDVVARGIARAMARQGGRPVLLDASGIGAARLRERFPTLTQTCLDAGFDWTADPVPVTPAAHYLMGGITTDLDGRTDLPGLLAVGECASTGVHGANRLASNSLLEGLVFGARAAAALSSDRRRGARGAHTLEESVGAGYDTKTARVVSSAEGRAVIHEVMWRGVGLFRDEAGLRDAIAELDAITVQGHDVEALETVNLLTLARLTARAALARQESRGAHTRIDFPDIDPTLGRVVESASTGAPC